jgi:hypothetical protein
MKRIIILFGYITLICALSSCKAISKPTPLGIYRGMEGNAPQGTAIFRHGWQDGCESGISALGSLHYKATHSFQYDPAQLSSNEYHNAWRLAFRYCRWYTSQWTARE